MVKVIISKIIRSPYNIVIGEETLRVINVQDSFTGISTDKAGNQILNKPEFQKLADDLEPSNNSINLS